MATSTLIDAPPLSMAPWPPQRAHKPQAQRTSPLDVAFLFLTALIPVETPIQAGVGLGFALGRLILPLMIVLFLGFRGQTAKLTLPPRMLWCMPWFIVAFLHIVASSDWYPIYNYRTYVLNAACSVVVYNYAKTNKPSATAVLMALFLGVTVFSVLCATGGIGATMRTSRFRVLDLDENGIGGIYGLGTVVALILCNRRGFPFIGKVIIAGIGVLCLWLTIRTGSRGALAAMAIPVFFSALHTALYRKNANFLIGFVVLALVLVAGKVFYDQSDTMKRRLDKTFDEGAGSGERFAYRDVVFLESWRLVFEKPLQGWGEKPAWDELGERLRRGRSSALATHNTFMQIMVTGGLFCGAMFLWYMFQPFISCRRFLTDPDYTALLLVLMHYYSTSLTLDQLGYRLWWWIFPLILVRQQDLIAQTRQGIRSLGMRATHARLAVPKASGV